MKRIMESKSPLSQARPLNPTAVAQVSPFAGLLAGGGPISRDTGVINLIKIFL
jgi:hypothetical protein